MLRMQAYARNSMPGGQARAFALQNDEFLRLAINAIHVDLTSRNEAFETLALSFIGNGRQTRGRTGAGGAGRCMPCMQMCAGEQGVQGVVCLSVAALVRLRACAWGARRAVCVRMCVCAHVACVFVQK